MPVLDIASGDYVGFADGDDWYELDMFERLFELASSGDADIAFCNYLEFDESNNQKKVPSDGKKWPEIHALIGQVNDSDEFRRKLLRLNPVPWRKIYRRTWLEEHKIRFPVGDYFFEDNPFHWQSTILAKTRLYLMTLLVVIIVLTVLGSQWQGRTKSYLRCMSIIKRF